MNEQLQRLRAETAGWLADAEANIRRLEDGAAIYRQVIASIDAIAGSVEPETADETERRREKRDIRGAIVGVLQGGGSIAAPELLRRVVANIGDLTDSALARSLSSLVGDGSIIERDGVFSLPRPVPAGYNEAQAAK